MLQVYQGRELPQMGSKNFISLANRLNRGENRLRASGTPLFVTAIRWKNAQMKTLMAAMLPQITPAVKEAPRMKTARIIGRALTPKRKEKSMPLLPTPIGETTLRGLDR